MAAWKLIQIWYYAYSWKHSNLCVLYVYLLHFTCASDFSLFLVYLLVRKINLQFFTKTSQKIYFYIASSNVKYMPLLKNVWQCLFRAMEVFIITDPVIPFLEFYPREEYSKYEKERSWQKCLFGTFIMWKTEHLCRWKLCLIF